MRKNLAQIIAESALSKKEMRERLSPGDVISAKVAKVNEVNSAEITDVRRAIG